MEMKKNLIALFICGLITTSAFAFPKISLKKNQVAVITKVNVTTKSNMDFFNKAFNLTEEDIARPSNYFLPIIFDKQTTFDHAYIEYFESIEEAEEGQYCVTVYTLPANRTVYFTSPIRYLYHKIYTMDIGLPTNFKVQVPEDVNCIYMGDLYYTVKGDNFEVVDLKVKDTYDSAAEFFKTIPGLEKEKLARGQISAITEADVENIVTSAYVNLSKPGKRFTMKNRVYSYR